MRQQHKVLGERIFITFLFYVHAGRKMHSTRRELRADHFERFRGRGTLSDLKESYIDYALHGWCKLDGPKGEREIFALCASVVFTAPCFSLLSVKCVKRISRACWPYHTE